MFIKPDKYMDLKTSSLKIGSEIIMILLNKKDKKIKYTSLYNHFFKIHGEECNYILTPAINFLFLLGKIIYNSSTDELELIK